MLETPKERFTHAVEDVAVSSSPAVAPVAGAATAPQWPPRGRRSRRARQAMTLPRKSAATVKVLSRPRRCSITDGRVGCARSRSSGALHAESTPVIARVADTAPVSAVLARSSAGRRLALSQIRAHLKLQPDRTFNCLRCSPNAFSPRSRSRRARRPHQHRERASRPIRDDRQIAYSA